LSKANAPGNNTEGKKRVAVVTGSSQGIGRAIVLAFAKSGNYGEIVVNSRKHAEAQQVSDEIKSLGCDSIAVEADMSKESDCIKLIRETAKHYGRIDVLVNNAGIQQEAPFEETSTEVWRKIIDVDLTGPFLCSREAVKQMRIQEPMGGSIINITSVHQEIPKPFYAAYAAAKAGVKMMTKTMALELARYNIRVNAVAPGAIETDMNRELQEDKQELNKVLRRIPLGRIGTTQEVASVVDFLSSDRASYVTGSVYFVDGGMTLYPAFAPYFDRRLQATDA
jgi:glucose 1-dehydrogenase